MKRQKEEDEEKEIVGRGRTALGVRRDHLGLSTRRLPATSKGRSTTGAWGFERFSVWTRCAEHTRQEKEEISRGVASPYYQYYRIHRL